MDINLIWRLANTYLCLDYTAPSSLPICHLYNSWLYQNNSITVSEFCLMINFYLVFVFIFFPLFRQVRDRLKQQVGEMAQKFPGFRPGLAILQVLFSLMTTTENTSCFAVVRAQLMSFIKAALQLVAFYKEQGSLWDGNTVLLCLFAKYQGPKFWGDFSVISFFRPCSLLECCVCEMVKSSCLPIKSKQCL